MNDMDKKSTVPQTMSPRGPHMLTALDRHDITVRGVTDVISFDEANVRLETTRGVLNLEGSGMRIHVLNTTEGVVAVTGTLLGVLYEDPLDETSDRMAAPSLSARPVKGRRGPFSRS